MHLVPVADFTGKDVQTLCDLAAKAGRLALQLQSSLRPDVKDDGTLVTEGDLRAEELLTEGIAQFFPGIAVVGEEYGAVERAGEATFYIDPIDGTLSYARGLPTWVVSVGLLLDGQPHLGVVVAPGLGRLWWGWAGQGAFCGQRPMHRGPTAFTRNSITAITTGAIRRFGPPPRSLGHFRCHGSIALETCFCADNQLDAAVLSRWKPWDIVGAAAIFLAAGGIILTSNGEAVPSWRGDFYDELILGGPNLSDFVPHVIPGWSVPPEGDQ